ncbi:MAG: rhomboid family intramembrane serine protease [Chloroflexota bacterium]|nr:rhomboid family intramembrane serine protease [Chloroflexota bacterium]
MFPLRDTIRSRDLPIVNLLIIGINVMVFLFEASLEPQQLEAFIELCGAVPQRFLAYFGLGQIATLFTSMFLHGGWAHLISNVWALYVFGDNVEDRMGHLRYLVFYLLSGVIAALTHIFVTPTGIVPTVGASGAISAVLGAYLVLFPTSRVITLVPIFFVPWFVEIPALFYLGFWFVSQLFNGLFALTVSGSVGTYGGVAWWAHVGGFAAGLILVGIFARRRVRRPYPDEYWPW